MTTRYLILPCSGIGKTTGTVARWAGFEVVQNLRPDQTRLLCLPRFIAGDEESDELLKTTSIIAIDGCPSKCASVNAESKGGEVVRAYLVSKFLGKNRDVKLGRDVTDPGAGGAEIARRLAAEVVDAIDEIEGGA
ncbi:MAG: putative zinc-binding protein [Promethearchaeota archaeon]